MPAFDYKKLFEAFSGLHALVVGDAMLDAYVFGNVNRISPEAPVPVVAVTGRESRAGGAANVAANLAALGAKPTLACVTGKDEAGKRLKNLLAKEGVSTLCMIEEPGRTTTEKTRIISRGHHLLRCDFEQTTAPQPETLAAFFFTLEKVFETNRPDVVIFQDYNKGLLQPEVIERISSLALSAGAKIAVDPKFTNFFSYKNCHLFKPNLKEVSEALGIAVSPRNIDSLKQADEQLRKALDHQQTLITLSEHGAFWSDGKKSLLQTGRERSVADVSGAGDTVISIAALCCALETGPETLLKLANLAGGQVCEKAGVVIVDREQLLLEATSFE